MTCDCRTPYCLQRQALDRARQHMAHGDFRNAAFYANPEAFKLSGCAGDCPVKREAREIMAWADSQLWETPVSA